jgi:hypothetical protein
MLGGLAQVPGQTVSKLFPCGEELRRREGPVGLYVWRVDAENLQPKKLQVTRVPSRISSGRR